MKSTPQKNLQRIILEYEPKVRTFFRRRSSSPEDVEDLTQTAIMAIMEGYPRFRGQSSVSTWIYAVCRNTLNHHYYYRRRDLGLLERLQHDCPVLDQEPAFELRLILDLLSPQEGKLYEEFYKNGRTVKEIAAIMERPEGTVKYLLYQLRRTLKRHLE